MKDNILYEDKYLIALLKKPGELSQSNSQEDMLSALPFQGHIINRLDQPVGGIVLIAKDKATAAEMTEQMLEGSIAKSYLAVVRGKCRDRDSLTDYLMINRRLNLSKVVNKGMKDAKEAKLSYELIAYRDNLSLIRVELYTGRHHQIRVQLAHNNTPIWGDTKYNPEFKHKRGVLPALFAYRLNFTHPYTNKPIEIKVIPDYGKFSDFSEEINEIYNSNI